ncbi:sigma-54 dependent transcriptional regulator [Thermostilla marina]
MTAKVLVVTSDPHLGEQVRNRLGERFHVTITRSLDDRELDAHAGEYRAAIAHVCPESLNGHSPEAFFRKLRELAETAPVFGVIDGRAPQALQDRAAAMLHDCFVLPADVERLAGVLETGSLLEAELAAYCRRHAHRALYGQTRTLITFTPSMFEILDELHVAAAHDVTVLLIGETGSGKTYLARMIHELSPRAGERCLTVACGALPPDLIESELFGYVKGAFTGADSDKPGKFAAADKGTLLLDEIDVLTPDQQAKLLRVIETGEYEPVGSNETRRSSARLIVASNIDLDRLVSEGKFRMDLYYRLNMLSFHLPPLRERPADIEFLTRKFALDHARNLRIPLDRIDPEVLAALKQYRWPGNIRELENVIRRAVLYCRDGVLRLADLPSFVRQGGEGAPTAAGDPITSPGKTLEERVDEVERLIIEEALRRHGYHRAETARELGISRVTLYHKMKKYGMVTGRKRAGRSRD